MNKFVSRITAAFVLLIIVLAPIIFVKVINDKNQGYFNCLKDIAKEECQIRNLTLYDSIAPIDFSCSKDERQINDFQKLKFVEKDFEKCKEYKK